MSFTRILAISILPIFSACTEPTATVRAHRIAELGIALAHPINWIENSREEKLTNAPLSLRNYEREELRNPDKSKTYVNIGFLLINQNMQEESLRKFFSDRQLLASKTSEAIERKFGTARLLISEDTTLGGRQATLLGIESSLDNLGAKHPFGVVIIHSIHPFRRGSIMVSIEGHNLFEDDPEKNLRNIIEASRDILTSFTFNP